MRGSIALTTLALGALFVPSGEFYWQSVLAFGIPPYWKMRAGADVVTLSIPDTEEDGYWILENGGVDAEGRTTWKALGSPTTITGLSTTLTRSSWRTAGTLPVCSTISAATSFADWMASLSQPHSSWARRTFS